MLSNCRLICKIKIIEIEEILKWMKLDIRSVDFDDILIEVCKIFGDQDIFLLIGLFDKNKN